MDLAICQGVHVCRYICYMAYSSTPNPHIASIFDITSQDLSDSIDNTKDYVINEFIYSKSQYGERMCQQSRIFATIFINSDEKLSYVYHQVSYMY